MRSRLSVGIFLALAALWMTACGARQHPMPTQHTLSADAVMANAQARASSVHAARARTIMEYYGDEGRVRVRQALLVREPGDMRLETLSPFQTTLAVVVTNAHTLTYYDLQNGTAYVGAPTARNLAKLIPLWLAPQDIVRVVLGSIPLGLANVPDDGWTNTWDGTRNAWRLRATRPDGARIEFWVRNGSWVLAGARLSQADGQTAWEIRTRDFKGVRGGDVDTEIPSRIRFLMPAQHVDVSLDVQTYELNPELDNALFEIQPPEDAVIPLDAPDAPRP